ncbi:MAG: leucine-rich repeat domain-containing protein [Bacteroidaceae bacterium]|nr:leucine-rich repeat domain-containing protein [Bacteroidaceae bacterium]
MTSIGGHAFSNCSGLTSFNIPAGVTSISSYAFHGCSGLTSVNIPVGVISIGEYAFWNCSSLTSISIPESVTSIGNNAFWDCSGLTSITIPESVTSIGWGAFNGCSGLASIVVEDGNTMYDSRNGCNAIIETNSKLLLLGCKNTIIPNGVTGIGLGAFNGCVGLTYISIPESVTVIGGSAFEGCSDLASIILPNNITSISHTTSYPTFPATAKLYVNRGTVSLITLWNAGLVPYQLGTETKLQKPIVTVSKITQMTVTFNIGNYYDDLVYTAVPQNSKLEGRVLTVSGLMPGSSYSSTDVIKVSSGRVSMKLQASFSTATFNQSITLIDKTASSITVSGSYSKGDANVVEERFVIGNETYPIASNGDNIILSGLNPSTGNQIKYIVKVSNGTESKEYSKEVSLWTDGITMKTLQPKVISVGNVIIAAETNVYDEEVNVGFEWRRTDWTSDFASNTGGAYLYEGMMEGYIRNLNAEKLWKFRPYYLSNSGTYYYGSWVGLDPSNTSYFEPTVHTYSKIQVEGNTALVKGYALRGTDNVTVQGFKYWKTVAGVKADIESRRISEAEIPADAMTVEAKGQVMTASLKDLDYESSYSYVAFMTTSEGETFYGEQQTFQTGMDTTPVIAIEAERSAEVTVVGRFDMQGRRISKPAKGINILLMSDGTTRKVMVQ